MAGLSQDWREAHGVHLFYGEPFALVWTGGGTAESWSRDFSHEILEMLVDPATNRSVYADGEGRIVEVADPVEWEGYRLEGVFVSDFVFPAWFAGATTGEPTCTGSTCNYPGAPWRTRTPPAPTTRWARSPPPGRDRTPIPTPDRLL